MSNEELERRMQVASDVKKHFSYNKGTGKWFWVDRDEILVAAAYHGPFDTFIAVVADATEPYFEDS